MNEHAHQNPIVITGVNGFVGKHLVAELSRNAIPIIGIGREIEADSEIADQLAGYFAVDLTKEWPDINVTATAVIHLAGLAAVGPSFDHPQDYINLNSIMFTHMAEYYLDKQDAPRLVVVSSGAIYSSDQPMPLTEVSSIGYNSPYVVSKVLVENQCVYYRNRGLDCIVVRPFNHVGPGQLEGFLVPDTIKQLQTSDEIYVGNLTTRRDYTDVRDVARAYRLLATTPNLRSTVYNVCSGSNTSGEQIVNTLKQLCGKPDAKITVDQSKIRPTDAPEIYGDANRLQQDTGWKPEIKLEKTLADCVQTS